MIASVAVGDGEAAVFEHDAHARDAEAFVTRRARPGGNAADHGHAARYCVAIDRYHRLGDGRVAGGVGGFGAVGHLPRGCVPTQCHRIGDAHGRTRRDDTGIDGDAAPVRVHGQRLGPGNAVDPQRFAAQTQPGRGEVHDPRRGLRMSRIGIRDAQREIDRVTGLRAGARGGLGQGDADIGPVEGVVDPDRVRRKQGEARAEARIRDVECPAVGSGECGQRRGGRARRRGVWGGRRHLQPVGPESHQRKAIFARRHRVDVARRIGHGLAAGHARRPGSHPVLCEYRCGLAGRGIDNRHPRARDRGAIDTVEDQAEGVREHINNARSERAAVLGGERGLDGVALLHAQAAVPFNGTGRNGSRADGTGEHAAVGGGFEDGELFAVARAAGDSHLQGVDCVRTAIGERGTDLDEKNFADIDRARWCRRQGQLPAAGARHQGKRLTAAHRRGHVDRGGVELRMKQVDRQRQCFDGRLDRVRIDGTSRAALHPCGAGGIGKCLGVARARKGQQRSCERCCQSGDSPKPTQWFPAGGFSPAVYLMVAWKRSVRVALAATEPKLLDTVVVPAFQLDASVPAVPPVLVQVSVPLKVPLRKIELAR